MKVMANLLSSRSGGALSYVRNLIPLLAHRFAESNDHKLTLLINAAQKAELSTIDVPLQFIEVKEQRNGYARALWEMLSLPKIIDENQIDVLFTPYQLAPNVKNAKTVVMIRNMEPFLFDKYRYDFKNLLRNKVLRRASIKTLRNADKVIAVSQFPASYCLNNLGMSGANLSIIYHGRDERFTALPAPNDGDLLASLGVDQDYIFTCGSMLPYRRCEIIIRAFSQWAVGKECQLVIAGSSNDQRYQGLIRSLIADSPVAHKIKWLGQVKIEPMRTLYRCCKLFVTTTDIEACPNIGIEALSSGCYIASSDNPPLPEIFTDAADYFQPDDTAALCDLFERHLSRGDRLNQRALARAESFSWETCSRQTFKVLTDWQ